MKDAMIVIAKFNQLQNRKLFALLDQLTDEQRKADLKGLYTFGSIHGALDRAVGTLAMSVAMLEEPPAGGRESGGPGGTPKYDVEDYEELKNKCFAIDQKYVDGFEAMSEEHCTAGPGVPVYDMVMKGMFIFNNIRGQIAQMCNELGYGSELISGALLS